MSASNELDRMFGLHALSSLGTMLIGRRVNGDVVLMLDAGDDPRDKVVTRIAWLTSYTPSDLADVNKMPLKSLRLPRPDTLARDRIAEYVKRGEPPWFAALAMSESAVEPPAIQRLSFCVVAEPPLIDDPPSGAPPRPAPAAPAHRETSDAPSGGSGGGGRRLVSPAGGSPGVIAVTTSRAVISPTPFRAPAPPVPDPDWTRLSHPELAHLVYAPRPGQYETDWLDRLDAFVTFSRRWFVAAAASLAGAYLLYRIVRAAL